MPVPPQATATSRANVALAVFAAHAALLWLLLRINPARSVRQEREQGFESLLLFPSSAESVRPSGLAVNPRAGVTPRHATVARGPAILFPLPVLPWPAPTASPSSPPDHTAPGAGVDWMSEAGSAAAAVIERQKDEARRLGALTRKFAPDPRNAPFVDPRSGFRWDYAGTHRFEMSGGLPVWNINDRCAMVLPLSIFFFCAIGHIENHGDLFEHMREVRDARSATPGPNDLP